MMTKIAHVRPVVRGFGRDRSGSVAVMAGLAAVPLMMAMAIAVDYSVASLAKSKLHEAADAAALAAVHTAINTFAADPKFPEQAMKDGVARFNAQAGSLIGVSFYQPSVKVEGNGTQFSATVSYQAVYKTFFPGLLPADNVSVSSASAVPDAKPSAPAKTVPNVAVSGDTTAVSSLGPYVDINLMIDNSSSMLIAAQATPGDMSQIDKMKGLTVGQWSPGDDGCAFACHWDKSKKPKDFYQLSRDNGVQLRLDQIRTAANQIYGQIANSPTADRYRFQLMTFNDNATPVVPLDAVSDPSLTPADAVGPAWWNRKLNGHQTHLARSIHQVFDNGWVSAAGNGSSPDAPRKYLFLFTDGVEDWSDGGTWRVEAAMDPAACDDLKTAGVTVAVVHTIFYDPNGELGTIGDSVASALQQCASTPTLYVPVSDGAGLANAVATLTRSALAQASKFTK